MVTKQRTSKEKFAAAAAGALVLALFTASVGSAVSDISGAVTYIWNKATPK